MPNSWPALAIKYCIAGGLHVLVPLEFRGLSRRRQPQAEIVGKHHDLPALKADRNVARRGLVT